VEIIHTSSCQYQVDWYDGVISDHMICAGSETGAVDTCQVAHGLTNEGVMTSRQSQTICECVRFLNVFVYSGGQQGASAVGTEESFYVAGVTGFGEECGLPRRPGLDAQTSRFSAWMQRKQAEALSVPLHRLATAVSITILLGMIWMLV